MSRGSLAMSKPRIMVVEDEGIVAQDICLSLEQAGYEVSGVAANGEDAIRKAQENRPDLVVMDVVLKGEMDGITAAEVIHNQLQIPVVYLTAYADTLLLERAKVTAPSAYLIKPFNDQLLKWTIDMALSKHLLETQLREGREWLNVTLNSIADALIATDRNGRVTFINHVAQTLTGWSKDEALRKPLAKVFRTAYEGQRTLTSHWTDRMYGQATDTSSAPTLYELQAQGGSTMIVEISASAIRNAQGEAIGLVLIFRDVTQRQATEARLRFLSQAVEQSSEGIAVIDLDSRVRFVNHAFAETHGYTPEECTGRNVSVFHTPEQMPAVEQAKRQLLEDGRFSGELWHVRRDGTVFPGSMNNAVLRDSQGNPLALIGALRDVTEIQKTEAALRASNEALEVYSARLEAMVAERTRELEQSRSELKTYSESLEKTNEALKVIIEGVEEQKQEIERKITQNLNLTVKPILDQLQTTLLPDTASFLVKSLQFNLANVFSSFGLSLVGIGGLLTPREIRISEMVRSGLSSKQIAKIMNISPQTVLVHRKNIRKKLALGKSGGNLATFLKANL
jgi:PAS domain S-box-containing protein